MVKWKLALIIIGIVVLSFGLSFGIDAIVAVKHSSKSASVKHVAISFPVKELYLGDAVMTGVVQSHNYDIAELLKLKEGVVVESLNKDIAEINDNIINVKAYGKLTLRLTDGENVSEKEYVTVKGINVVRAFDLLAISNDYAVIRDNIVLQNDVTLFDLNNNREKFIESEVIAFRVKSDFYGNGYCVDSNGFNLHWFDPSMIFSGSDNVLRDTRFTGKKYADGEDINLDELTKYGSIVAFGFNSMYDTKTAVTNCIFENSNRNAYILGATVSFNGCIFRNAADSNVSIKTVADKPSDVSFENCVMAYPVVAGISNWCVDSVPDESQCKIRLKSDVLFYCWRDSDSASIVPSSESGAKTYNGYLKDLLKTNEARSTMLYDNGKYYINSALLVVCTGAGNSNKPEITGIDGAGIGKYNIPFDWYVSLFLSTSDLYGYQNANKLPPAAALEDNPNITIEK